jgi:hypothetical protein
LPRVSFSRPASFTSEPGVGAAGVLVGQLELKPFDLVD